MTLLDDSNFFRLFTHVTVFSDKNMFIHKLYCDYPTRQIEIYYLSRTKQTDKNVILLFTLCFASEPMNDGFIFCFQIVMFSLLFLCTIIIDVLHKQT